MDYSCALMPGWLVSIGLAISVAILIVVFGSIEALTIFALMFGWFAVLGAVALGVETLIQVLGRSRRR